ncbi:hypothetical protein ACFYXZ_34640, partial [Streptomyces sp. NPDC002164]
MRNTKAFKEAVAQTLAELAHRGVTLAPSTVEDTIEKNINTVADRLGIQVRSAWRYFDASVTADRLVLQSDFAILWPYPAGNGYGHRVIIGWCVDKR